MPILLFLTAGFLQIDLRVEIQWNVVVLTFNFFSDSDNSPILGLMFLNVLCVQHEIIDENSRINACIGGTNRLIIRIGGTESVD